MKPNEVALWRGNLRSSAHGVLILFLAACAMSSDVAQASSPLYRNWSYLSIRSDAISVEVITDSKIKEILELRVEQDGKPVSIGREVYERANHPLINELQIEACTSTPQGSCSILVIPFVDQEGPEREALKELTIRLVGGQVIEHAINPPVREP